MINLKGFTYDIIETTLYTSTIGFIQDRIGLLQERKV